jgi:hypothetical protein
MSRHEARSEEIRGLLSKGPDDSRPAFPVWSPLAAYEAAEVLLEMLAEGGTADVPSPPSDFTATAELKS